MESLAIFKLGGATRPVFEEKVFSEHFGEQRAVKEATLTELYPALRTTKACTLLLLSNLAYPEWIPIGCKMPFTPNVLCVKEQVEMKANYTSVSQGCFKFDIMKFGTCFYFFPKKQNIFQARTMSTPPTIKAMKQKIMENTWNVRLSNIQEFHSKEQLCFLFQAVDISTQHQRSFTRKDPMECRATLKDHTVFTSEFSQHPIGNNIFHCTDGSYISAINVCNDKTDCADRSDEFHCMCNKVTENEQCKYHNNSKTIKECSSLFYKSKQNLCSIYKQLLLNKTLLSVSSRENNTFQCVKSGIQIKSAQVDDLVSDCGPAAEDEERLKALLTKGIKVTCSNPGEIPCMPGHSKCFQLADVCVYSLDIYKNISPCRTGTHLAECTHYECHMKHKCPGFYCIQWSFVCDGKWDCPFGFDEERNHNCDQHTNCSQLYKCKQSTVCIHLGDVCDQKEDCPHREDEQMCDAHKTKCPQLCVCLAFAIKCWSTKIVLKEMPIIYLYMMVSISFSNFEHVEPLFRRIECVSFLHLSSNNITTVCLIPQVLVNMHVFDVSDNNIVQIKQDNCISNLHNVRVVRLEKNKIELVEKQSFNNLLFLQLLNMSYNCLTIFHSNWITLTNKQWKIFLAIKNNTFNDIEKPDSLHITLIETTDYRLCCLFPSNIDCDCLKPWYISCSNLLPNKSVQIVIILVSVVLITLNIVSVVCQVLIIRSNRRKKQRLSPGNTNPNSCMESVILSINGSDLFLGMYFVIIWTSSLVYHEAFFLREEEWRSHFLCFLAFAFVLLFSFASPVLLCFMCLMRFQIVASPLHSRFKDIHFVLKCLGLLFSSNTVIAIVSTCVLYSLGQTLPFSLCLPFVDPSSSIVLFKILVVITTSIQFVSSVFIAYFYRKLVKQLKIHAGQLQQSATTEGNQGMIMQLVTITLSNIVCWFPSGIIYIISIILSRYPTEMVFWTTIIVMPINSILNPIIFVITARRKLKERQGRKPECKEGV